MTITTLQNGSGRGVKGALQMRLVRPVLTALGAVVLLAGATTGVDAATCGTAARSGVISALTAQAPGLRAEVLRMAINAAGCAASQGLVKRQDLLTVIDYSIPSSEPRLFVFDLATSRLLFRELVAHGKNSGDKVTTRFSNLPGSLATSLGLFVTDDTYLGNNGYSLRLNGLERGVNDRARERAIVMHGADYVSSAAVRAMGRVGRSWGCPAIPKAVARKIIDTVKGGTAIFAYYPESSWLEHSRFLVR